MSLSVILTALAAYLLLSLLAVLISSARRMSVIVYGGCLVLGTLTASVAGHQVLSGGGAIPSLVLPFGLPWMQGHLRLDLLTAFFLFLVNTLGAIASLYALNYGHHEKEPARVLPFFPLFLAGMSLVTLADDGFVFLIAWEIMSLASWLLVLSTHKEQGTLHASYVYLVMAVIGSFALFAAFAVLAGDAGDYSFAAMRAHHLSPVLASVVLGLVVFGAGAKAGLVPMHAWLPLAHPAAPSHISALMSGVMTKVALYGIIRVAFDLIGAPLWWWGGLVMTLGGITAVTGILYALMQSDLKRLLAYSTVENIGIVTIGLGLALAFKGNDLPLLSGLALTAALFHILNHAVFKSLLFFGAGSVLSATGTRDMDKQGGLIHRMPVTAFLFLIGAMAISALPPFNGFISEWLIFQSILSGTALPQWLLKLDLPVVGGLLALAAAFTAVAMVKAYGVVFLGRARTTSAAEAKEVGMSMQAAMGILAVACVVIGTMPYLVLTFIRPVVEVLLPRANVPLTHSDWLMLRPLESSGSSYSGLIILLAIAVMTTITILSIHRLASNRVHRGDIWDCGFPNAHPNGQYTASSFTQPIRRIFGTTFFSAKEHVLMPEPGDNRTAQLTVSMRDHLWENFYARVVRWINFAADKCNATQFLTIRTYLSLMFVTLVGLLVLVAVIQ